MRACAGSARGTLVAPATRAAPLIAPSAGEALADIELHRFQGRKPIPSGQRPQTNE